MTNLHENTRLTLTAQFLTQNQDVVEGFEMDRQTDKFWHVIDTYANEQTTSKFNLSDAELEDIMEEDDYKNEVYTFRRNLEDDIYDSLWEASHDFGIRMDEIESFAKQFMADSPDTIQPFDQSAYVFAEQTVKKQFELDDDELSEVVDDTIYVSEKDQSFNHKAADFYHRLLNSILGQIMDRKWRVSNG